VKRAEPSLPEPCRPTRRRFRRRAARDCARSRRRWPWRSKRREIRSKFSKYGCYIPAPGRQGEEMAAPAAMETTLDTSGMKKPGLGAATARSGHRRGGRRRDSRPRPARPRRHWKRRRAPGRCCCSPHPNAAARVDRRAHASAGGHCHAFVSPKGTLVWPELFRPRRPRCRPRAKRDCAYSPPPPPPRCSILPARWSGRHRFCPTGDRPVLLSARLW